MDGIFLVSAERMVMTAASYTFQVETAQTPPHVSSSLPGQSLVHCVLSPCLLYFHLRLVHRHLSRARNLFPGSQQRGLVMICVHCGGGGTLTSSVVIAGGGGHCGGGGEGCVV